MERKYAKPVVVITDDLAEGVYTASGSSSGNSVSYSLQPYEQDTYNNNTSYMIQFTNNGTAPLSTINVTLRITGSIDSFTSYQSGNLILEKSGSDVKVTCIPYWGNLEPGAQSDVFSFSAHGTGTLS
jgi:hypothetical protein